MGGRVSTAVVAVGPAVGPGTERDGRRATHRRRVHPRARRRPGGAHPVRRRRLSRCGDEPRDRPRGRRRRRGPPRGRPPVLGPARGRRHAPAGVGRRARGRGDARGFAPAHRTDRRRSTGPAARADGLREPGHRRRRRRGRRAPAGGRWCRRPHRRRPHAGRGRAVRGRRPAMSGWPSSISWRRRRPPPGVPRSPRGVAASCTAYPSSG